MAALGRVILSVRNVVTRLNLQESVKSSLLLPLLPKTEIGWATRCLATSNQGVAKVKMHSRTPYIIFANEKMGDLRTANPGIRVPDLGRMLGQMWRLLPEADKEAYRAKYQAEKVTFDVEKKAQIAKLSEEEKADLKTQSQEKRKRRIIKRRKKLMKELDKPKPVDVNPYILFVKTKALERGDAPFQQYVRGLSEFWKKMPEEDKQPFVDKAKQNSIKYRKDLAAWERRMIAEGHEDLVRRTALKTPRSRKSTLARRKSPRKVASKKKAVPAKAGKTRTIGTQTGSKAQKSAAGKKSDAKKSEE